MRRRRSTSALARRECEDEVVLSLIASVVLTQCTISGPWSPASATEVEFEDGGAWAMLGPPSCDLNERRPHAHATFNTDGGIALELESYGVQLSARLQSMYVEHRTPLDFGLGFRSSPATRLEVMGIDGEVMTVAPAPRTDAEPLAAWMTQRLKCQALSPESHRLQPSPQEPHDLQIFDVKRKAPTFSVRHGANVQSEGRLAVVTLNDGATIRGALARAHLQFSTGSIIGSCLGHHVARPPARDCAEPLELWVSDGHRIEHVGRLGKGTLFDVRRSDGTWVEISPRDGSPVGLLSGWRWVVSSEQLERCSRLDAY